MRFLNLLVCCLFMAAICNTTFAQRNCGAMEYLEYQISQDSERLNQLEAIENHTQRAIQNPQRAVNGVITIPTVVHVIYSNSNENISEAQINSQIRILNEDFRRTNSDANNYWSQAADVEIEFCLASVDPNGNATTGITRKSSSRTSWGTNDDMKKASAGGVDPWNSSEYLNMWVCNIGGGILGYAQFPGGNPATDGVVMGPNYFGDTGYVSAPFDKGRTTTHEVGHWLNLRHIWGDGNCNADDFVADTPTSDAANYGCATGHTSCNSRDMVENYMDYSDDACMNLFTAGQKARMRALFDNGGSKASFLNSNGCGGSGPSPTCSDGIQNQGETGVDCGGPCPACGCNGTNVTVTIKLDNYPGETAWTIKNANGVTVASGGNYSGAGTTVSVSECLPDGCYDFNITDSYGDGICCSYGNGNYSVTNGSTVLASGGAFASSETTNFCLGGGGPTPVYGCTDANAHNYDPAATDDDGSCETCSDGSQNGDETGVDCGGSKCAPCPCTDVVVTIKLDNYPEETSWTIKSGNTTVAAGGTYGNQADGSTVSITECLDDGCYTFTINDSYGDGICCSYGNGNYTVKSGGTTLASGGSFGASQSTNICIGTSIAREVEAPVLNVAAAISVLDVYPNPTRDELNVSFITATDMEATLMVTDITGKVMNSNALMLAKGEQQETINVSGYESGFYIVHLISGDKRVSKKFVVMQ